jgi:hypothetical protein
MASYIDEGRDPSKPSRQAVRLFKQAQELQPLAETESAKNRGPLAGPLKCRYIDIRHALHGELGIKPWMISPLDVHESWSKPQPYNNAEYWHHAQRLRRALLAALDAMDAR